MQRWTAIVFVGLVAVAIMVVAFRTGRGNPAMAPSALSSASASASTAHGTPPSVGEPSLSSAPPHMAEQLGSPPDAGIDLDGLGVADEPGENANGGRTLPDGRPAPALPAAAPQTVTFGAVLIEYQGAQGATASARTRDEAVKLSKQLASLAKTDFKAAVAQGDKGSSEELGGMQRNILEPAPEYVLFSLAVGDVSEPVDSPRGFYIFKRID